jgi:methyl-accepting chemotaxis protein
MTTAERELLASLRPWARRNGGAIADALAARVKLPRDWAARHFEDIFREAAKRDAFGVAYFERRLREGAPAGMAPKWFLGVYPVWLDAVRDALHADVPEPARVAKRFGGQSVDAELLAAAERALARVFNYDAQAMVEAYVYETLTAVGADLGAVGRAGPGRDLSDLLEDVRAGVRERLDALTAAVADLRALADGMHAPLDAAGRGFGEVSGATASFGAGAARQAEVAQAAREAVGQAAASATSARELTSTGIEAAAGTIAALDDARARIDEAATAITALAGRSLEVGGIVEAIQKIASQTTVLAINAGIEAYHAGEHGRSFAVLADEVRRLAERAARSASDAGELIAGIQGETDDAVKRVRDAATRTHGGSDASARARDTLEAIDGAVTRITAELDGIGRLTDDLSALATEAAGAAERTAAVTHRTGESADEAAATLQRLTERLSRLPTT